MIDKKYLTEKHKGMKISLEGVLSRQSRVSKSDKYLTSEIIKNLHLLSDEFYKGNIKIVDQFLQLYDLDESRPKSYCQKCGKEEPSFNVIDNTKNSCKHVYGFKEYNSR